MSVRAGALGGRWAGALGWRVRRLAGAEAGVTTSIVRSSSA
jgi:hypothetical protein